MTSGHSKLLSQFPRTTTTRGPIARSSSRIASAQTSFLLDGLRFAMLETGNHVYIELVEMKQPMQSVGESEVFWHLALRTDHLEKSLEAAVNAGCEVAVPIRPLDLLNDVTQKPWPMRVAFFRGPDGELIELLEDKTGYT